MTDREAIDVLFNEWKCIDRNDGIHCDRKCETCDLVMDVGIIREAFNMAISALQEQDSPKPTAGSVQNVQNEDLISRKAAIDAIVNTVSEIGLHDNSEVARYGAIFRQHEIIDIIEGMPAAQPELETVKCIIGEGCMDIGDADFSMKCAKCGAEYYHVEGYNYDYNFCPNCGRRWR